MPLVASNPAGSDSNLKKAEKINDGSIKNKTG
jgi:hypothetical protein